MTTLVQPLYKNAKADMTPEQHDEDSLEKGQDTLLHIHLNEYRKLKDEQITRIVMREQLGELRHFYCFS